MPFGLPARLPGEMHEAAGVGADVKQPPRVGCHAPSQLAKDRVKDEILVSGVELVRHPLFRPPLVVHAVEEARQRGELLRLTETARRAPNEPDPMSAYAWSSGSWDAYSWKSKRH